MLDSNGIIPECAIMPSKKTVRMSDVQRFYARSSRRLITSLLLDSRLPDPFQGEEDLCPELAGFTKIVSQADVRHAGIWATSHCLELGDYVFQPKGFACGLGTAGFEHGMHSVDVEMVIRWLVCPLLVRIVESNGKPLAMHI